MEIRISNIDLKMNPGLREFVKRQLHLGLSRYGERLRLVRVLIETSTSRQPEKDYVCHLMAELLPGGHVVVGQEHSDLRDCVTQAVARLERSCRREIERQRWRNENCLPAQVV